jgi:uncharacterized membrane protein
MRWRSAVLLSLLVYAAACRGRDTGARASADSTTRIPDTTSTAIRPGPDPAITDSHTIYEARSLAAQPFWAVDIFGQGIRYRTATDSTGVVFGAGRVEGDDSASTWTAKRNAANGPKSLQLRILRMSCTGGTGGTQPYRVALLVDGQAFQGCARRGTQATRRP